MCRHSVLAEMLVLPIPCAAAPHPSDPYTCVYITCMYIYMDLIAYYLLVHVVCVCVHTHTHHTSHSIYLLFHFQCSIPYLDAANIRMNCEYFKAPLP